MSKEKGLSSEQVKEQKKKGFINGNFSVKTKSIGEIIFTNVFTLFNFINIILAFALILVHSYKNMLFLGVVLWNVLIGVIQEVRSKRIIDKLSLLSTPQSIVIRDGKEQKIDIEDIVLDDVLVIKSGNQVSVDSMVIEGECEVDESFLTGESDLVNKKPGDEVLSGSYIINGNIVAKAIHVGKDNYVNKITGQAKYLKRPNSEILKSIKLIIKFISIALVPIAVLLLFNQLEEQSFEDGVVRTVAGVIGMIPSGLVLLTSMVLAVSVIRLGKKNTLVQELYCIETLARVDVLCLDKTGTITKGTMSVENVLPIYDERNRENIKIDEDLYEFTRNLNDDNPTFNALWKYSGNQIVSDNMDIVFDNVIEQIGFSSEHKWSLVDFENKGTFILGALEFVFSEPDEKIREMVNVYSKQGLRVLIFAYSKNHSENKNLPKDIIPLGIVTLSDTIREEAVETFRFFTNQGVNIKVISGDNPLTVSYVAKKAGIRNADKYIDATLLQDDNEIKEAADKYTVFGRVTPNQKLILIKSLKELGHTVAMTGDGVNDVMALKESDCSIAMQSGSDAARNVSQLVLMDSNFSSMPAIVAEGRRTINNLQRSASLYLTKTMYSTVLAILFMLLPSTYPFIPIQMTFIGCLAIGMPSFILAMEPNVNRVKGKFIVNVLKMAIPGALLVVTNIVAVQVFEFIFEISKEEFSTMCLYGLAIAALLQLIKCCRPFNKLRHIMCMMLVGLFVFGTTFFKEFLGLESMNLLQGIFMIGLICTSPILYRFYSVIVGRIMGSEPNVYQIYLLFSERSGIVLVEDDVERKDYYDVAAQMKGVKVLKADKVGYVKPPENGGNIRVESAEMLPDMSILVSTARYFVKKNKIKENKTKILVETDFFEKPIPVIVDYKEHESVIDKEVYKQIEFEGEPDNIRKVRYVKKLKMIF